MLSGSIRFWVLLALVSPVAAQAPDALQRIVEHWRTAYNNGDAAQVAALYAEDALYISAQVEARGRPEIENYLRRGVAAGGHLDYIRPLASHASRELAWYAGTYQATDAGMTVEGRMLLVLRKVNGRWLIAAHETVVRSRP